MRTEESINEVIDAWRDVIKNKKRLIFSFDERAQIRLNTIKEQIYSQRHMLNDWWIREGFIMISGNTNLSKPDWRNISPGDSGGGRYTAFFKRQVEIPEEWRGKESLLAFLYRRRFIALHQWCASSRA